MKTVLVESLKLTGGDQDYDISSVGLNMTVGAVPTCNVQVITGYNMTTGSTISFSDSGAETIYSVEIGIGGEGTTTLFKGYINSVSKSSSQNVMGGSAQSVSISLIGVQARLMKYGGSNFAYFGPGGPTGYFPSTGCQHDPVSSVSTDNQIVYAPDPTVGMKACMIDVLAETYGYCIAQDPGTAEESAIFKDLDELISDPWEVKLSSAFTAAPNSSIQQVKIALESLVRDRYGGTNMLNVLFSLMSPEMFMIQLAPRLDTMEMLPTLPWMKNPTITVDKQSVIAVQATSLLKNIRRKPDMIGVVLTDDQNSSGVPPTPVKAALYPPTLEGTSAADGGTVQIVTLPDWLVGIEVTGVAGNKDANKDARILGQTEPGQPVQTPMMADLLAKAYFGATFNHDRAVSLVVPWYQFDFLYSTGYVIKVTNMETVPEGGTGTFYGRLASVSLNIQGNPSRASCSMKLGINNLRSEAQNELWALETNPIYDYKDPGTVDVTSNSSDTGSFMVGAQAAAANSPISGVGEGDISGFTAEELANATTTTTYDQSVSAAHPITNNQTGATATSMGHSEFASTYSPSAIKNA